MDDAQEKALVDRARAGEEEALTELLQGVAAPLRARLAKRLPTRWQSLLSVDDVLQQTFTDAFLEIARFVPSGPGAFAAWMGRLAENNLKDAIRMLEADKRGSGAGAVGRGGDSYETLFFQVTGRSRSTPSQHAQRAELVAALHAALERLPSLYARAIRAVDLEGGSIADLAQELGRTPGAVHLLRHRAHRRLGELLR